MALNNIVIIIISYHDGTGGSVNTHIQLLYTDLLHFGI